MDQIPTPTYDKIANEAEKLKAKSNYKCDFDFKTYKSLEERYAKNPPRGGVTFKKRFFTRRLIRISL